MRPSSLLSRLALGIAPLLVVACATAPERGPVVHLSAHGPLAERVETQVGIVDKKLAAVEALCTDEGGELQPRCLAPLHELKRKRAYYRQRAFALTKTATSGSLDDITAWQALEIEVELLTLDIDELADELRHSS